MIKRNFLIVLSLLILLVTMGTLGYHYIEKMTFFESFYMTIITVTTTGFMEVRELSDQGRLFTIFLLIFGMGIVAYSVSKTVEAFLNIDFSTRRRKLMEKQILKLKGHIIVCGFGRMGQVICQEFANAGKEFVVIDNNPKAIDNLEKTDYLYVNADAAKDETLISAGIKNAAFVVSMIDDDADGLYLVLAARSLNNSINIVSRATDDKAKERMLRAGANKVVLPIVISGLNVASTVLSNDVQEYLDVMSLHLDGDKKLSVMDRTIKANSEIVGKSFREVNELIPEQIIMGVKVSSGEFLFKPSSEYIFKAGDCLYMLGTGDEIPASFASKP